MRKHTSIGIKRRKNATAPGTSQSDWAPSPVELDAIIGDVVRAYSLLAEHAYRPASELFARIAALVAGNQHFRRAAQLYGQALLAALRGGNITVALAHSDRMLGALAQTKNISYTLRVAGRLQAEMSELGYHREAQTFEGKLGVQLSELGLGRDDIEQLLKAHLAATTSYKPLPDRCPTCTGPVYYDEIDWTSEARAHCAYCDSNIGVEVRR